jgi:hypothetical protein
MIIDFRMPGGNATIRRDGLGRNAFLEKAPSPGRASLGFRAEGRMFSSAWNRSITVGAEENPCRVESEPKKSERLAAASTTKNRRTRYTGRLEPNKTFYAPPPHYLHFFPAGFAEGLTMPSTPLHLFVSTRSG